MENQDKELLFNTYNFNLETAYKINSKIPAFGIEKGDGTHKILRNAKFLRVDKNTNNPSESKVCLEIPLSNGDKKELLISEEAYQYIINCVQNFNNKKINIAVNSFEWDMLHIEYAEKMKIDDCIYKLNSTENFYHNFSIHCRNHEANNSEQAIKIAEIMYERMAKREQECFIKMKKAIIKKAKDKNAFEKYVIAIFEKFDAMGEDISNDDIQNIPSIEIRNITSINSENNSNNNLNHEEVIQMDKNITRWEYKIVNLHEDGNIKTNYLGEILPKTSYDAKAEMTEDDWNLLGNAGWEATGNTFTTNGYSNKVLLKRLKSN